MDKQCTINLTYKEFLCISSLLIVSERLSKKEIPEKLWDKLIEFEKEIKEAS